MGSNDTVSALQVLENNDGLATQQRRIKGELQLHKASEVGLSLEGLRGGNAITLGVQQRLAGGLNHQISLDRIGLVGDNIGAFHLIDDSDGGGRNDFLVAFLVGCSSLDLGSHRLVLGDDIHSHQTGLGIQRNGIGRNAEGNRGIHQLITLRGYDFDQMIVLAVRQNQRGHKITLIIGLECINISYRGVSDLLGHLVPVRVVNLELRAAPRNDLAVKLIDLHNAQVRGNRSVVDCQVVMVVVNLANQNGELRREPRTLIAGLGLMHHIGAVGQLDRLAAVTQVVGRQDTALVILSVLVRAGGLQPILELCTALELSGTGGSVGDELGDGECAAIDDLDRGNLGSNVVFDTVVLRLGANVIHALINLIASGRLDFTDGVIIAADVLVSGKLAVAADNVLLHQLVTLIETVHSTLKDTIAARDVASLGVRLLHSDLPLLQYVGHSGVGNFLELHNETCLHGRNNILHRRIDFLQRVVVANQDILEDGNTVSVGGSSQVNSIAGDGSSMQPEGNALDHAVLRGLGNAQVAALELVVDIHGGGVIQSNLHAVCHSGNDILGSRVHFLNAVVVANQNVVEGGNSGVIGHGGHIHRLAVDSSTGQTERDTSDLAVLGGLLNLNGAASQLIMEVQAGGVVERDGHIALDSGNNVPLGGVDFLYGIVITDKDFSEHDDTVLVGRSSFIDCCTGDRRTGQPEGHACHEAILGGLRDFQIAASQLVLKLSGGAGVVLNHHASLHRRNNILRCGVDFLQLIVVAHRNIIEGSHAVGIRNSRHVDSRTCCGSAGQTEGVTSNLTIL